MRIVNLTPHNVTLCNEESEAIVQIPPSGQISRVKTQATKVGEVEVDGNCIPIVSTNYGEVEDLPNPEPETTYVVSVLVLQALRGQRSDVVAPDTGPESVVRDGEGHIFGVKRLTR